MPLMLANVYRLRCRRHDQKICRTKPKTKISAALSVTLSTHRIMAIVKQIVRGEYFLKNSWASSMSKVVSPLFFIRFRMWVFYCSYFVFFPNCYLVQNGHGENYISMTYVIFIRGLTNSTNKARFNLSNRNYITSSHVLCHHYLVGNNNKRSKQYRLRRNHRVWRTGPLIN